MPIVLAIALAAFLYYIMLLRHYIRGFTMAKIFYGRCSKDEEIQKNSIEAQKKLVEDAVGECDEYFTDTNRSGASGLDKRLGLAQALETIKKGDELIVARLDRLARDVYLSSYITLQVEKKGARIVSATEESLNGEDATSKLLKTIITAFSAYERQTIRARIKATMELKKSKGERVSRYAPYGYDFTEDAKRVIANDEEQKVLSLISEMKNEGSGVETVRKELNRRGIKTKRGKSSWHYQTIYKIYQKVA